MVELPGKNRAKFVETFQKWIIYALTATNLTPSQVIEAGTVSTPSMEELSAYFVNNEQKTGGEII
jgi:hypothetical protein